MGDAKIILSNGRWVASGGLVSLSRWNASLRRLPVNTNWTQGGAMKRWGKSIPKGGISDGEALCMQKSQSLG